MNRNLERLEEKTEISLNSKQIMILAFGLVMATVLAFMAGYFSGRRTERNRGNVSMREDTRDLLSRLDELEEKSRAFVAKKALTITRKRHVPLNEFNDESQKEKIRVMPLESEKKMTVALSRKSNSVKEVKLKRSINLKRKARTATAKKALRKNKSNAVASRRQIKRNKRRTVRMSKRNKSSFASRH
ncbi:MAG: hypothetical protein JXR95_02170 [Deltaproteobacteria bacterium]|nr:hypothetical protein [Deltaproteobacteria bacterium]